MPEWRKAGSQPQAGLRGRAHGFLQQRGLHRTTFGPQAGAAPQVGSQPQAGAAPQVGSLPQDGLQDRENSGLQVRFGLQHSGLQQRGSAPQAGGQQAGAAPQVGSQPHAGAAGVCTVTVAPAWACAPAWASGFTNCILTSGFASSAAVTKRAPASVSKDNVSPKVTTRVSIVELLQAKGQKPCTGRPGGEPVARVARSRWKSLRLDVPARLRRPRSIPQNRAVRVPKNRDLQDKRIVAIRPKTSMLSWEDQTQRPLAVGTDCDDCSSGWPRCGNGAPSRRREAAEEVGPVCRTGPGVAGSRPAEGTYRSTRRQGPANTRHATCRRRETGGFRRNSPTLVRYRLFTARAKPTSMYWPPPVCLQWTAITFLPGRKAARPAAFSGNNSYSVV